MNTTESKYQLVSSVDSEGTQSIPEPPSIQKRLLRSWKIILIFFLSLGWLVTAACWYQSRPSAEGPLHVYTNSPIPRDVFKPVKKVFQLDERYVGGTPEADVMWDKLVAGKSGTLSSMGLRQVTWC